MSPLDIERIKSRLIGAGADPEAVENALSELDSENLEALQEASEPALEFMANLTNFLDYLDHADKYKRKRVNITLAEPVYNLLKHLSKRVVDSDGRPYPMSYFLEDILIWVLKDLSRFDEFLEETYEEAEGDEEAEET